MPIEAPDWRDRLMIAWSNGPVAMEITARDSARATAGEIADMAMLAAKQMLTFFIFNQRQSHKISNISSKRASAFNDEHA